MQDKIEGRNPVMEAIRSGQPIDKIYVKKGENGGSLIPLLARARKAGIPIVEVDRQKLDAMSETRAHQGVIAQMPQTDYVSVEDLLRRAEEKGEAPFLVLLDRMSDPHNLGSIVRTANCAGAHGVIISKHDCVGATATAVKASAGAMAFTPVARVTNLSKTIDMLKEHNIWVTGTDASGEKNLYDADFKGGVALVIGSEGEGISRLVLEKCDYVVRIPMHGDVNSLNASVAAALVLFEAAKQRG